MSASKDLDTFLTGLGAKRRSGHQYVLDGFSSEFYIYFDASEDADDPVPGTVDILIAEPGTTPSESARPFRLRRDCTIEQIQDFMIGIGFTDFRTLRD
jgi:hypothetical protein